MADTAKKNVVELTNSEMQQLGRVRASQQAKAPVTAPTVATPAQAPATPTGNQGTEAKGTEATVTKPEENAPATTTGIGERTELAIKSAIEMLPEAGRPSED